MANSLPVNLENKTKLTGCCNTWKPFDEFVKDHRNPFGISSECKTCKNIRTHKDYHEDIEVSRAYTRDKRKKNLELYHIAERRRYWQDPEQARRKGREYDRERRATDPEYCQKRNNSVKKYASTTKGRKAINKRRQERLKTDPNYKATCNLRNRINKIMRVTGAKKFDQTMNLINCSLAFLTNYLLSKFLLRYGYAITWQEALCSGKYKFDHIIPCEAFEMALESAQGACFHYSNLQILTIEDNDKKSDFLSDGARARFMKQKYTGLEPFLSVNQLNNEIKRIQI